MPDFMAFALLALAAIAMIVVAWMFSDSGDEG